jgi:ferredoxin
MKVNIDTSRCQGHGRCYDLAPDLFGEDEEGYGVVRDGGIVAAGQGPQARLAAANCPESAIGIVDEEADQ